VAYFIYCTADPDKVHLRDALLTAHQTYVRQQRDAVVFGGIVPSESRPFEKVCYFVDVASAAEANAFVARDPYSVIYSHIEIMPFQQRIPHADDDPPGR
jgi:uncharacterized protein YciI